MTFRVLTEREQVEAAGDRKGVDSVVGLCHNLFIGTDADHEPKRITR